MKHLFYAGFDGKIETIGYASSKDGISWKRSANPIIPLGQGGEWDSAQTSNPCVLYENGKLRMWYQGKNSLGVLAIGYAESTDGREWEKYSGNPVFHLADADTKWRAGIHQPHVIKADSGYELWCVRVRKKRGEIIRALSSDGLSWEIDKKTVISPEGISEGFTLYYPWVISGKDIRRIWYSSLDKNNIWNIHYAELKDGVISRHEKGPVIARKTPSISERLLMMLTKAVFHLFKADIFSVRLWNYYGIANPCVVIENGDFAMYFQAVGIRGKMHIGRSVSRDGIHWGNQKMVLAPSGEGFDSWFVADPYIINED